MHPMELDSLLYYGFVVDPDSNTVLGREPWFIKFFAPWCPHCQHMQPAWETLHVDHMWDINVASVDCTTEYGKELCSLFGIRGYPTLMYLPAKSNKYHEYSGDRSLKSLSKFALEWGWDLTEERELPISKTMMERMGSKITDGTVEDLMGSFLQ